MLNQNVKNPAQGAAEYGVARVTDDVALVLPFISTWFTESARQELAIAAELDLVSGQGTIKALKPI